MTRLDELVTRFGEHDATMKYLKRESDAEKDEIKALMRDAGETKHESGAWSVTCTTTQKESLDEEKLLRLLKEDWVTKHGSQQCPYIKTIECVDMDALESALYNNQIEDEMVAKLDSCRSVQEVVTLRCSKTKKREE